jgi:chromate reductase, NAD(P)H dehydrogenase (quinone)
MHILAVAGSLREGSYNVALARAAAEFATSGVTVDLYHGLGELPHYDADMDGEDAPESVRELRRRIADADAVLLVTPEYNGSIPGVLKNAVDWASRPARRESALWGKTVAVAGASTGSFGALWAQQDLRRVLGIAGARVIEGDLPVPMAHESFDADGRLVNEIVATRLRKHLQALAAAAEPLIADRQIEGPPGTGGPEQPRGRRTAAPEAPVTNDGLVEALPA